MPNYWMRIGPEARKPSLPVWVPAAGNIATLTVANGGLANSFASQVDTAHFGAFWTAKIVNDYSGSVVNPYFGPYGSVIFEGGGHSGTNDNSVIQLELGTYNCTFRRVTNPTPLTSGVGTADTDPSSALCEYTYCEMVLDGQPVARHSYGAQDVVGPADGGAAYGTFYRVMIDSGLVAGRASGETPHKIDFDALTGTMAYERAGTVRNAGDLSDFSTALIAPPQWTVHVPAQDRIYIEVHGASTSYAPRWFDLSTGTYVTGTGTQLLKDGSNDGGIMFHVPSRDLLVFMDSYGGTLRIQTMDVTASDPSWITSGRPLSSSVAVDSAWSAACWCADNNRIIVGDVTSDADCVYEIEIPSTLTDTWPCTRVAFTGGQTITWAPSATYKKWSYNTLTKSIVYLPYAGNGTTTDTVFVYRPRNT